jgi:hypothetical protein
MRTACALLLAGIAVGGGVSLNDRQWIRTF